jgi:FtsH-binding integral membrane protein
MANGSPVAEASRIVRLGFIRKVYGILTIQLMATAFVCALAMKLTSSEPVSGYHVLSFGTFLAASSGFRIFIFIFTLLVLFGLFAFANKYPHNMIILTIW